MVEAKVSAQRPQGRFARHVSKRLAVPMLLVVCIKGELQTSGVWVKRLDKPGPWRQMHLYEYEQRLAKLYNRARPGV